MAGGGGGGGGGVAPKDQYNDRSPAISRAKCWYGRLLITLHGHYGRPFCLINLNISSFIVANLFNKICNL